MKMGRREREVLGIVMELGKNKGGKLSKRVRVHRFFWKEVTDDHRWEGQGQGID